MSDKVREQLSAAADDEVDGGEWTMLLRRLQDEPGLRAAWASHHLIGEAIRGRVGPFVRGTSFADKVASAVSAEPGLPARRRVPWVRLSGGVAVAASVAAMALLSLRPDLPVVEDPSAVVVPVTANPQVGAGTRFANAPGVRWEVARPEVQAELNRFLLDHAEAAPEVADEEGQP